LDNLLKLTFPLHNTA